MQCTLIGYDNATILVTSEGVTPVPRMKILNSVKCGVFDSPPMFNSAERKRCFDFPAVLRNY